MKKVSLLLSLLFLLNMAHSYAGGARVKVCIGRPAPTHVVVIKPDRPGPDFIWIEGHYDWSPRLNRYVWVEGHWKRV